MRAILTLLAVLICGGAQASSFPIPQWASTGSTGAQWNLWFHGDANVAAFAATAHPGVTILSVANGTAAPSALAGGYKVMMGLGGYASLYAHNLNAQNGSCPTCLTTIEGYIDNAARAGATWIYVDEPWGAPNATGTGQQSATTAASIAFNVAGFNTIWTYIHNKWPGVKFGLTIGDDGGPALHLSMLQAAGGTQFEDFASTEDYNSCCTSSNPSFTTMMTSYPNVIRMYLAYGTESLCQGNGAYPPTPTANGLYQVMAGWDTDNYGGWIGPLLDASFQGNLVQWASTGSKSFCQLPYSWVNPSAWTHNTQTANFTVPVVDSFYQTPAAYTIDSCQYQVMSGANAINGPGDPSVTVTVPWTTRACNANLTITVGATGNCNVKGAAYPAMTCLVFTRAHTTAGVYGNITYQGYAVSF